MDYDHFGKPSAPSSIKSDPRGPDKESRYNWMLLALLIVGLILYTLSQAFGWFSQPSPHDRKAQEQPSTPNYRARMQASQVGSWEILKARLKAPSTATIVSRKIAGQDGTRHIWHYIVDAQNSFGAMLRGSYLVAVRVSDTKYGDYYHHPSAAVMECSNPPSQSEIANIKQRNGW